jgi:hypothetical protein
MKQKIIMWLIERLYRQAYEPINLDKINQKLIRPVPGLVIDGVQYFEFVNIGDVPRMRLVHYTYMREEMVMGIDRDLLLKLIGKVKAAHQANDGNLLSTMIWMFEDIVTNVTTIEAMYNVASVVYFDPKEDIACYDYDYNLDKIKKFKTVKDKSFFFSYLLQNSLKITADKLPKDMMQFLNENAVKLAAWKSIISEPTGSES